MATGSAWPPFPNAPITEALLDIQFAHPEPELETLAKLQDRIGQDYPDRLDRKTWTGGIRIAPDGSPLGFETSGGQDGYLFRTADGKQIVQARKNGYSFSRLQPYPDWATFSDEALRVWNYFVELVPVQEITRIALRYINKIEVPLPCEDLKLYFKTLPDIEQTLPQGMESYLMRVVIPFEKWACKAIITQATDNPQSPGVFPIIFDTDVFSEGAFIKSSIVEVLERLRQCKDEIFFASLTDRAKELFR